MKYSRIWSTLTTLPLSKADAAKFTETAHGAARLQAVGVVPRRGAKALADYIEAVAADPMQWRRAAPPPVTPPRRPTMGENSGIQWTDHTFNPWWGCVRISPGCQNCYAEALDKRVGGMKGEDGLKRLTFGAHGRRARTSAKNWREPLKWNAEALARGVRAKVFCASMADVFETPPNIDGATDTSGWLLELLDLIARTPMLDWQLLTKRPDSIVARLNAAIGAFERTPGCDEGLQLAERWLAGFYPPNVWLGTTVEDRQRGIERIPHLLKMPASIHFLSCEPLLQMPHLDLAQKDFAALIFSRIDWLIIGGESGPNARPFFIEWARELVAQARMAGVAPFVKQMGSRPMHMPPLTRGWVPLHLKDHHGGDMAEWPSDLRVREFPRWRP